MRPATVDAATSAEIGRHIPGLDGLRALAILLVIPHNLDLLRPPIRSIEYPVVILMHAGWIGVQLFFVLSGFLITGNLLDTRGSHNYFSAFFGRRALRILPLYLAVLILTFVIVPAVATVPPQLSETWANQLWLWTFLVNWMQPYGGGVYGFSHFWSLAVEEQFYLLWPIVVLCCRPVTLSWVCGAVAALALVTRAVLAARHFPADALYMFTICRMDALAMGAAAAALLRIPAAAVRLRRSTLGIFLTAALTFAVTAAETRGLAVDDLSTQTIGYTLLSFGFALLILLTSLPTTGLPGSAMRLLSWAPLRRVGRYSYGMYVFHLPLSVFFGIPLLHWITLRSSPAVGVTYVLVMTLLTFILAAVSYELFESPFLRMKRRLMPTKASS
jgi:peptidoglycan/LPS O-acetylase OafA/YrhL